MRSRTSGIPPRFMLRLVPQTVSAPHSRGSVSRVGDSEGSPTRAP